jgi:transitional endoplasmic reticulum ATPase
LFDEKAQPLSMHDALKLLQKYREQLRVAMCFGSLIETCKIENCKFEYNSNQKVMTPMEEKELADKNMKFEKLGKKIIIPEEMSYEEAIKWLHRKKEEEETEVSVSEPLQGYPFDGALAFSKAMADLYGWSNMVPTPGFFGPRPPAMIGLEVGFGETVQVPWGSFAIPGVEGRLETTVDVRDGLPLMVVSGTVLQKHKREVKKLCDRAREFLREESIYRGKAIRVSFPEDPNYFDVREAPKFLDVSQTKPSELIFPDDTQHLVEASLFTPVEHTEQCRAADIPLKRGVLLEGPFGTGKTLTAYVMAKKCQDNGWTFIYLDKLADLPTAVRFAQKYEPALIFAEDIDRAVGSDRNDAANDILNTIDGIDAKNRELIVVLTTNNVEKIHPAMLRPGRLDAVIPVRPPDQAAAVRLLRLYGRGLIDGSQSLAAAGKKLEGQIPAVIREVVERSKLTAINRLGSSETKLSLSGVDLEKAADGMLAHLKLIAARPEDLRCDGEKAADRLGEHLGKAVERALTPGSHSNGSNGKRASTKPGESATPHTTL